MFFKLMALVGLFLSMSCTTSTISEKRDPNFKDKITDLVLVLKTSENMIVDIRKNVYGGPAIITSENKKASSEGVLEIQKLIKSELSNSFRNPLLQRGVKIFDESDISKAHFVIVFRPVFANSECAPAGCNPTITYDVTITDLINKKRIWSAFLKVGAVWPKKQDEAMAQSFFEIIMQKLMDAELLN